MTTHVRHLKTEFADDPTDPAQLVGSQAKYEFLGFFSEKKKKKKKILGPHQMTSHFLHFSRTEKFPLVTKHNRTNFGADPKRVSRFPKNHSLRGFQKTVLAISFSILKTRTSSTLLNFAV